MEFCEGQTLFIVNMFQATKEMTVYVGFIVWPIQKSKRLHETDYIICDMKQII